MRSNPGTVSTKRQRIAELAKRTPKMGLTSLNHHLDIDWLREAYRRTRKDGAVGVDGVTAAEYEQNLEDNLRTLLDRAKSGLYRAPPVRRVYIPKGSGGKKKRPIGIPTLEDKILQRAVVMLLEPIYEEDFLDGSYGFRPDRSPHQALAALWKRSMDGECRWLLEVDIQKFFDTLDHAHLRQFLKHRVRDGVILRLIGKWLKAGVMEEGNLSYPKAGSPQGGVISPLLANVYLHYVLDEWVERDVRPRMRGRVCLIRYADDFVMGFTHEGDARKIAEVLPKRLAKYGLRTHPEKTRLRRFHRPPRPARGKGGSETGRPETFDFLGFTHYWGRSLKGSWMVKRKTARSSLTRALIAVNQWCKRFRHLSLPEQQVALGQKIRGHCSYFGIVGNSLALVHYRRWVIRIWKKWLSRRSRERNRLPWDKFERLLERYPLQEAVAYHSYLRYT
jgi:RNA-directed DNA polymerase